MILRIPIAAAIACLLGCSTPGGESALVASHRGAPNVSRFAILPTNALVPLPAELSGARERVLGAITRYLGVQRRERRLVELPQTRQLWRASIAEVNASDSLPHDFQAAMRVFTRGLLESTAFDALVVPSLVYREAKLSRRSIKWDGVIRRLGKQEDESRRVPESFRGVVSAVSLHVMVFSAGGELIFENYGGVDLAHELTPVRDELGGLRADLRDDVLEEHRFIREGVELAFEPYLPRPSSTDW